MKTLALNPVAADVSPLQLNAHKNTPAPGCQPRPQAARRQPLRNLPAHFGVLTLLLTLILAVVHNAPAASATWTGGGADSAWTTTGNWSTSPVPGAGDTATFNGAGNGKTVITTAPASLHAYLFDSASCAAYTISAASTTWAATNGGGVTINSSVNTDQDLSGIQFIRLTNGTVNFINQGSGLLKIGTCFNANSVANSNMRLNLAPASGGTIEIASGKNIDNASTAGRTTSILVNDTGTVRMSGTGTYSGPDADGNALTLRQGTFSVASVAESGSPTLRSPIGMLGRVQFGEAGQSRTAALQYTATTAQSSGRPFYIIDNNTARFDISQASGNLTLTTNITQSASTFGGGNLTKIGAGTLTLTGTNLHTGDTLVSAGTLVVSNNFGLTNSTFDTSGAGTLSLPASVTTPTFGGLKGSIALTLPATVTMLTLNPGSGKTPIYSGTLSGGTLLGLVKTGAGTQTLGGSNSFGNNVTITAGTLKLAHSHALGTNSIGLLMQGTGRVLQLSGGITLGTNITLHLSSTSADQGGVVNVDGDNEIRGHVNFTTGNAALNIYSSAGALTLSGNINLSASTRTLYFAGTSLGNNTVSGPITETGGVLPVVKQGVGKWIFSGTNTYTGNTTNNGGTLVLADNAQLKFVTGANGVNNQITGNGSGTVTLDGDFNLDLTGADDTIGNSWTLVDVANVTETFGSTFTVKSSLGAFTENANVWTRQDGAHKVWTFTEATGVLNIQLVNIAPVAKAIAMGARAGVLTSLPIIGGKHSPTDDDGDAVTLQSVAYTSGNGATLAVNGGNVEYTAASSFSGTDSFTYTVSDSFGGTDTKTVTVAVTSANAASLNVVYGPALVGGDFVVRFAGVPGTTYTVETNGTPAGPGWVKFNNYTAPTESDPHPNGVGIFQVTKPNEGEGSLYFRTIHPSY